MIFMEEENKHAYFTSAKDHLESYVQDRLLLIKLQATEKSAKLIGVLTGVLLISILSFFVLFFVSIMAGYFFAEVLNSMYAGFGIVTGIYAILLGILIARKKYLEKFVANTVVKIMFDKSDHENDEEESH